MERKARLGPGPLGVAVAGGRLGGSLHKSSLAGLVGWRGRPKARSAFWRVSASQFGIDHQATRLQVERHGLPRLLAFAIAVSHGDQLFGAVGRGAQQTSAAAPLYESSACPPQATLAT